MKTTFYILAGLNFFFFFCMLYLVLGGSTNVLAWVNLVLNPAAGVFCFLAARYE